MHGQLQHPIPGIFRAPNVGALNVRLAKGGLKAEVVVVDRDAGLTFGRRRPADVPTGHAAQWRSQLRFSVDTVASVLGIEPASNGLPNLTGVGFAETPRKLRHDQLIQTTKGAGFLPGENPHDPCVALVSGPEHSIGLGLITPFADAPPVYLVYVDQNKQGKTFVVTASIQAMWPLLTPGSELIQRTLGSMVVQVMAHNLGFDLHNVWAFVGPGASEDFYIGGPYADFIEPRHRHQFVETKLVPMEDDVRGVGRASQHNGWVLVDELNLRGWVAYLLREAGIPDRQVAVVEHDTVNSVRYTSKRRLDKEVCMRAPQPHGLPSNALVGLVTRL